jgi:hypothetical protein
LIYKVEAKDVINAGGQEVTLSYWAKGTSPTNGLSVGLLLVATGGSATGDQVVTLTSTWTKYTHTFTMPSFSGVTLNASSYLELHFDQDAGDTGTAAWELNIAQVQLEVGSVATPFEHRSYGEELSLCQRYCEIWKSDTSYDAVQDMNFWQATAVLGQYHFQTEKRVQPTLSGDTGASNWVFSANSTDHSVTNPIQANRSTPQGFQTYTSCTAGTIGSGGFLRTPDTGIILIWDAEL